MATRLVRRPPTFDPIVAELYTTIDAALVAYATDPVTGGVQGQPGLRLTGNAPSKHITITALGRRFIVELVERVPR